MSQFVLSFKPASGLYGQHDPAAALFEDGALVSGIEEERFTREKHASRTFPDRAIRACRDHRDLDLEDVDRIVRQYDPGLGSRLHPADDTTRPQTIRKDQNPRYYRLLREFKEITGVPAVLDTSYNDHGEPIVNTFTEALKDFFGMGLNVLAIKDLLIVK